MLIFAPALTRTTQGHGLRANSQRLICRDTILIGRALTMVSSDRNIRSGANRGDISTAGYRQLAEFRYRIRQFLHFSEEAARACRIEPQQHQLLLAIKGLPKGTRPTVTRLSNRLCLRHHSTVEL